VLQWASTAIAVFLKSTPLKPRERTLSLKIASEGLRIIGEIDGVRCCKASTYASIMATSKILVEELGVGFLRWKRCYAPSQVGTLTA